MRTVIALAGVLFSHVVQAQVVSPSSASGTTVQPAVIVTPQISVPSTAVLRAGTPVSLRMLQQITTKEKTAKINDRVRLEVAEAVKHGDIVVIPAGSPAVGELTDVRYKGMWGKSGRIVGRVLTVDANGRTIRMSGTFDTKGGSGTAVAVVTSAVIFLPAGFFMTGKSAEFQAGSIVRGFIDEDVSLSFSAAQDVARPMAVSLPDMTPAGVPLAK